LCCTMLLRTAAPAGGKSLTLKYCVIAAQTMQQNTASCAGLTRASIFFEKESFEGDGLPGQARQ
jgi:hypothetical protein